ncbi:MAG TPA: hypothetical protein VMJ64_17035, partial [Anaerolineales bacterium]|nr:hypothetical protein [Anaerolineales bacterium]
MGSLLGYKENIPNSPQGDGQLLKFRSLLELQHPEELLYTDLMLFEMDLCQWTQGDSNPRPS